MKRLILFLSCLAGLTTADAQSSTADTIHIDAYSSYNTKTLSPEVIVTHDKSVYDSVIIQAQKLIGLPDNDIEIGTVTKFGAYSAINFLTQRRYFLYSVSFFDSVYNVTGSFKCILSICFHELAHQYYRHPLKHSANSLLLEKQADYYSGFQMCITRSPLEESLAAMKFFGNDLPTDTHPDKATRLAEIEKGYYDARHLIFGDTSTIAKERAKRSDYELMNSLLEANLGLEDKEFNSFNDSLYKYAKASFKKVNTKKVYSLYGVLVYIDKGKQIKTLATEEVIGRVESSPDEPALKRLNLQGVNFEIGKDNIIYSTSPGGIKTAAGNKIIDQIKH